MEESILPKLFKCYVEVLGAS